MTIRWNTERIARELKYLDPDDMDPEHIKNARASVRSRIKRWQDEGWVFDVEIDMKTNERLYVPSEIREAQAASPGKGHRRKSDVNKESA